MSWLKTCSRCKRRKPTGAFRDTQELGYVKDGMGDGKHDVCRDCIGDTGGAASEAGGAADSRRGRWLRREEWHSICSRHQAPRRGCPLCGRGCWRNAWLGRLSRAVHAVAPRAWRWWRNRNRGDY